MGSPGRPRVQDRLGDPLLGEKAVALRGEGRSWSEIGLELGIGRSTARRLTLCQNSEDASRHDTAPGSRQGGSPRAHPFQNDTTKVPERQIEEQPTSEKPLMGDKASEKGDELPESFRLFERLLRRAGVGGQKRA